MPGRYGALNYPRLTKRAMLLGIALFLVGALGELAIHTVGVQIPAWEETLLFDVEVLGVVVMLLSPFVFGILLPLTE